MKMISKILAIVLILVLTIPVLSSCGNASYIATNKNGEKINSASYAFWAYYYQLQLKSSFNDEASLMEYLNKADSNSEDTRPTYQIINSEIQKVFETTYVYKQKAKELKLEPKKEIMDNFEASYDNFIEYTYTKANLPKLLSAIGATEEQYKVAFKDIVSGYSELLLNHYFGKGGEKEISDETILKDFVRVKHILIAGPEYKDAEKPTDEEKKKDEEAKKKADDLLAEIKSGKKDFDELMNDSAVNADYAAVASNPNGYIYSKESSQFVEEFTNAGLEMKVNEMKVVKSDFGYHIMKKEDLSTNLEENRLSIISQIKSVQTDFDEMMKEWIKNEDLKYNNAALKKFDIRKLKKID